MLSCIAIIISICSLGFSIFVYFKHDKKIKGQSAILNELQIKKFTKEEEENKKAKIQARVIKRSFRYWKIEIFNVGKSTARSVMVIFDNGTISSLVKKSPFPIDIEPQHKMTIEIDGPPYTEVRRKQFPDKVKLIFSWEDNFSNENNDSQTIQL